MQLTCSQTKAQVLEIISDPKKGKPEDKLRLFLVYLLSVEQLTKGEIEEFRESLTKAGCDLRAIKFVEG